FVTDLPNLARRYPSPLLFDERTQSPWRRGDTGMDQGYWAEAAVGLGGSLTVTPGLRASHLGFDETPRLVLEPRVAARSEPVEGTALTAATGIYRKLPDIFSGVLVDGFGQPNLRAERALQMVTGVEQHLGPVVAKVEGFYVKRDQLPSPTD